MNSLQRFLTLKAFLLVLIALALGVLAGSSAADNSEVAAGDDAAAYAGATVIPWLAVAASGPVEALPAASGNDWLPVRRGDELLPRTQVRTGRRGRATLTRSANVLIVDPDSLLELPDSPAPDQATSVIQPSGSVVYEVDGRENRDFRVVTPYLVAGVKGTTFLVSVTDSHAAVTVDEGTVEVRSNSTGETVELGEGETVLLGAEDGAKMERISRGARKDGATVEVRREARRMARAEARKLARAEASRSDTLGDAGAGLDAPGPNGDPDLAGDQSSGDLGSDPEDEEPGLQRGLEEETEKDQVSEDIARTEAKKAGGSPAPQ